LPSHENGINISQTTMNISDSHYMLTGAIKETFIMTSHTVMKYMKKSGK